MNLKVKQKIPLKIKRMGINGEGIAFHEGKPVFIENAIPDEVIEFDIKSDEGT